MANTRKSSPPPSGSTSHDARNVIKVEAGVFKNTCLQLLDRVRDQELVVEVTRRGTTVARVVPPDEWASSAFGFMRGTVVDHDALVSPDVQGWGDRG